MGGRFNSWIYEQPLAAAAARQLCTTVQVDDQISCIGSARENADWLNLQLIKNQLQMRRFLHAARSSLILAHSNCLAYPVWTNKTSDWHVN